MLNQHVDRSLEREWMDDDHNYTTDEYDLCLKMLFRINRFLNIYGDTAQVLREVNHYSTVLDVGCGDGLFIIHLSQLFPHMRFTGTDVSPTAIEIAQKRLAKHKHGNVNFELLDEPTLPQASDSVDVVMSTLMCHHLSDIEIVNFIRQAVDTAREVVIINDLHRHFMAQWLFKLVQPIFFRNQIVKHDGLVSIRRSFKDVDWQSLLSQAGVSSYQLQWRFPFRWRIVIWKKSL